MVASPTPNVQLEVLSASSSVLESDDEPFGLPERYVELCAVSRGGMAKDSYRGTLVAVKRILSPFNTQERAKYCYREVHLLRCLTHPNLIKLHDAFLSESHSDLFIITDYINDDLRCILNYGDLLPLSRIKTIMFQLLQVLEYMHAYDIVHRDLKPENLLLTTTGELKVCDLGLARRYEPEMTGYLATRYYRAPEFMLTWRSYGPPVDIWSTGCILAELATGKILFPGVDHVHHLRLIIALIGSPPETVLSKICSPPTRNYLSLLPQAVRQDFSKLFEGRLGVDGVDLLKSMLEFDPTTRIAPRDALLHPFFKEVHLVCPPQPPTQFEPTIDECVDWRAKLLAELEHKA